MQTLTAGSFLNLENNETVEALKYTARRLAEHSANVIKENLPTAALESLADSLWGKAEYLTRETERRRLQQIFIENFRERFRELKPGAAATENSDAEVSPVSPTIGIADSNEKSSAPEVAERETSETAPAMTDVKVSSTFSPENSATVAEGKRDEFLGFVASGESFGEERSAETGAALIAPEESARTIAQTGDESAVETSRTEVQAAAAAQTPDSANQVSDAGDSKEPGTTAEIDTAKTETTTVVAAAPVAATKPKAAAATTTTNTAAASAGKNGAGAQEPFEFEKCTINLNLTLLPAESGSTKRKMIVGATSHSLPPEIDFLEVGDGDDLTQIADQVREKLARFKQTLPVKYIEQLRNAKNKSAKKPATAKPIPATAAASQPAGKQGAVEKTSGGQKTREASNAQTEKPQPQATVKKSDVAASSAPPPAVNQPVTTNSIQGSLF